MTLLQQIREFPPIVYLRTLPEAFSIYENSSNTALSTLITLTMTVATAIFVYKRTLSISAVVIYIPFTAVLSFLGYLGADNIFRLKKPVTKDVFEFLAVPVAVTVTIVVARFFRVPSTLAYIIAPVGGLVGWVTAINILKD